MCTLVLWIPFDLGSLLISDRQSTKYDGTKEEWDKIYLIDDRTVVGFAGPSEGSRLVAQTLPSIRSPLPDRYITAYDKLRAMGTLDTDRDIVALCISKVGGIIEAFKFTRNICNSVQPNVPTGIGTGEAFIRPQLSQPTNTLNYEDALKFGKTLIEYSSRIDSQVGPPAQLGFCLATIPVEGNSFVQILAPETVSISDMLYPIS
jgi:hypothetical protein